MKEREELNEDMKRRACEILIYYAQHALLY